MTEPSILACGASYSVNGVALIDSVDFAASTGDVVGVLGPNGAGKSTLLRLLAGELLPDDGRVTLQGRDTRQTSAREMSLLRAMLGQSIPAAAPFTVRAIVEMGRYPHRLDRGEPCSEAAVIDDAMRRTRIADLADRVYSTLSSGERTRVFLARVIAQDAPIVLLDEPTSALDVGNSERILREAISMAGDGRAVVAVLHDLNAAAFYCDRIYLLAKGKVRVAGHPSEVLQDDVLSEVYAQRLRVVDHPFRDCPLVLVGDAAET